LRFPQSFSLKVSSLCSESARQIDYLEKNFLNPLKEAEKKSGKVILAQKDRKTLQKILGIIETSSLYLVSSNQVAGKLNFLLLASLSSASLCFV
jgi:hypothetical protein